ncbi:MAG TPA: type IV pilus biogenesis/stability protein PilW [Gammaproteobacteria bacterium]|nr:type IV pilus biogenesis/stability protein PilW [Gammaproteobacteria bacterium]
MRACVGKASLFKAAAVFASMCALQGCATSSSVAGGSPASDEEAAQANMNLGVAYLSEHKPQLALEKLERALDQNPRLADAHSAIAIAYDQLGQPEEAEKHYRRATQLAPDNPGAANSYAVFLCRKNRWRDAEPYFKRAADNPRYTTPAVALTNAGTCAMSAGDLERAESYFRAALEKDKSFADALAGLMDLSYRRNDYLEARAFMQRYLDARPATAPVLWMCFNVEQKLGDAAAAQRCATQLQQNFPTSAEVAELRQFERDGEQ